MKRTEGKEGQLEEYGGRSEDRGDVEVGQGDKKWERKT